MQAERWDPQLHLAMLNRWSRERGLAEVSQPTDLLPPIGAVAGDCAACFLYTTDAHGLAYLDGLMTDRNASHDRRRAATHAVFEYLSQVAMALGVTRLIACTRHAMPLAQLHAIGFKTYDTGLEWLVKGGE